MMILDESSDAHQGDKNMTDKVIRVVFMGSPDFAVPTLEALVAHPRIDVCAVVTQPDKLAGRGKKLTPPPVKVCAQQHGIRCFQPEKLKTEAMYAALSEIAPDFFVTIAYGKILRQSFLDIPRIAPLNLHASLLPRLRGAAPIQWAVIREEAQSGVCLMRMDAGMDTGPVYARRAIDLTKDETAASLHDKLSQLSAEILMAHIFEIADGHLEAVPQEGEPTLAPTLQKSLGAIRFDVPAHELDALCRGLYPWPAAYAMLDGKRIAILMTSHDDQTVDAAPGTIVAYDQNKRVLRVACACGCLCIALLQPEGKKPMDASSFANGYHPVGKCFVSLAQDV